MPPKIPKTHKPAKRGAPPKTTLGLIVAIAANKGGVGKSMLTIQLAGEARARGLRVLVADADPQRTSLTWTDVASEGGREAPTVVGASTSLRTQIPPMAEVHDLTLIDCPPRGDLLTRNAIYVADMVLVPTGPSASDFWALADTIALVTEAQALRPSLRAALVLNRIQSRRRLSTTARAAAEKLGLPVLASTIGFRSAFEESFGAGMSVNTHSPKTPAADEIRALLTEIMEAIRG